MLKAKYMTLYSLLWIYINISSICENNTVSHLKFGQQLCGLTLSRCFVVLTNATDVYVDSYVNYIYLYSFFNKADISVWNMYIICMIYFGLN